MTDLTVPLPGRDYSLVREYSSDPELYATYSGDYFWNNEYTSTIPGRAGAGWDINAERYLQGNSSSGLPYGRLYLRTPTGQSSKRFDFVESGEAEWWVERGGGNNFIREATGDVLIRTSGGPTTLTSTPLLHMGKPGGRISTVFVGYPSTAPSASTFQAHDLSGKIAFERDEFGNFWYYEWASLGESAYLSRDTVRVRAIYFNGAPGSELARVEFNWHGDPSADAPFDDTLSTDPRFGRLAEAKVIRPDGTDVLVQSVRYVYYDDIAADTLVGDTVTLGNVYDADSGDLVEVVQSTLTSTPGVYQHKVHQYRYYAPNNGYGDDYAAFGLLPFEGFAHQLMGVIYPEQMEFYADHVMQEAARQDGTSGTLLGDDTSGLYTSHYASGFDDVRDAAALLRWVRYDTPTALPTSPAADHDDAAALLLANARWQSLHDISGKLIAYYPSGSAGGVDGRVRAQIVSSGDGASGCGCGSGTPGMNLGRRFDYLYRRYVLPGDLADAPSGEYVSNGYTCQIVESYLSFNTTLSYAPYRVECHDYLWPSPLPAGIVATGGDPGSRDRIAKQATATVPANTSWDYSPTNFTNAPASGSGNRWATVFEYDLESDPTTGQFNNYRKLLKKLTPAAIGSSYQPAALASATAAPDWDHAPSSGLVHLYHYVDGWLAWTGLSNGVSGTPEILAEYERNDSTDRIDLATQVVRGPGTGPSGDTPVETTTVTRGYFGGVNGALPTADKEFAVVAWERTQRAAESVAQNGPSGTVDYSEWALWDAKGQLRWSRDAAGTLTLYQSYDARTGVATRVIHDADPSGSYVTTGLTLNDTNYPGLTSGGWSLPTRTAYEELEELIEVDLLGRVVSREDAGGVHSYFRYEMRTVETVNDAGTLATRGVPYFTTVTFPHGFTESSQLRFNGPITASVETSSGKPVLSESYIAEAGSGGYDPLTENGYNEGDLVARSDMEYSLGGALLKSRVWHDVGMNAADGSYVTQYQYDPLGRLKATIDPEGGVSMNGWKSASSEESGYDLLDRVTQTSVGLASDDDSVRRTSRMYYDSAQGTTPGIGNSNLTRIERYTGETTGGTRVTRRWYDLRNRLIAEAGPELPYTTFTYDNLNRVVEQARFASSTGFTDGSNAVPAPSTESTSRSAYVQTLYNNRGMVYRNRVAIDPDSGDAPTGFLTSDQWFDARGSVIALWSPNGPATKTSYDALGRDTITYVTDRFGDALPGASGNHAAAASVSDDHVLEQTEFSYVPAGEPGAGSMELVTQRSRLHHLTDADVGALDGTSSVSTFSLIEFDAAGRSVAEHFYGTNSGSENSFRSGTTAPSLSSSPPSGALVNRTTFDAWGRAASSIAPDGKVTLTVLDAMSRQVAVVESQDKIVAAHIDWNSGTSNWDVDWEANDAYGTGFDGPDDADRVTTFTYDGLSNIVKRTAHFGDGTRQVTTYVYGTDIPETPGSTDSLITSSSLLWKVHYPNESTGMSDTSAAYTVTYGYNLTGEVRRMQDQNETVHAYTRDGVGRVLSDTATIVSSDLDDAVTEIAAAYDVHGRLYEVLSKDGSTTLNSVRFGYTPLHQVDEIIQNASGGPTASGAESVQYTYETFGPGASGIDSPGNFSRLSSITYPDQIGSGPTVEMVYFDDAEDGTGDDDRTINDTISRLRGMHLGWTAGDMDLVAYQYLGASAPVALDYTGTSSGLGLDYTKAADGTDGTDVPGETYTQYFGFDQFGRVVWHPWVTAGYAPGSTSGFPDRSPLMARAYGYDLASNRVRDWDGRPGAVPENRDWRYEYDNLDRLQSAYKGRHTPGATDDFVISAGSKQWNLDILGNWVTFYTDDDTAWPITWESSAAERQDRTHNMANEILSQSKPGPGGSSQIITEPLYDAAGNYRQNLPSNTGSSTLRYTHDAWNRLVRVERPATSDVVLENEFNGLNWRVIRRMDLSQGVYDGVDEERMYYYSAEWRVLEEHIDDDFDPSSGSNAVDRKSQQFWGIRYIDDAVAKRIDRDNDGVWSESITDDFYYLTDVMFSVRGLTDRAGFLRERVDYTPYGVATSRYAGDLYNDDNAVNTFDVGVYQTQVSNGYQPGDAGFDPDPDFNANGTVDFFDLAVLQGDLAYLNTTSGPAPSDGWLTHPERAHGAGVDGTDNSVGYDGYWFDLAGATETTTSGLYMVRHRVYDPRLGRWIERDPANFVDGSNRYQYGLSEPTLYSDHSGLTSKLVDGPRSAHGNRGFLVRSSSYIRSGIEYFDSQRVELEYSAVATDTSLTWTVKSDLYGSEWNQNPVAPPGVSVRASTRKLGTAGPATWTIKVECRCGVIRGVPPSTAVRQVPSGPISTTFGSGNSRSNIMPTQFPAITRHYQLWAGSDWEIGNVGESEYEAWIYVGAALVEYPNLDDVGGINWNIGIGGGIGPIGPGGEIGVGGTIGGTPGSSHSVPTYRVNHSEIWKRWAWECE